MELLAGARTSSRCCSLEEWAARRSHPFRGRGLRIPTLREAFETFPQARFNLELKEDLPKQATAVNSMSRAFAKQTKLIQAKGETELVETVAPETVMPSMMRFCQSFEHWLSEEQPEQSAFSAPTKQIAGWHRHLTN